MNSMNNYSDLNSARQKKGGVSHGSFKSMRRCGLLSKNVLRQI